MQCGVIKEDLEVRRSAVCVGGKEEGGRRRVKTIGGGTERVKG